MMTLSLGEGCASVSDLSFHMSMQQMRYTGGVEICDRHAYLPSTEKIKYFLTFEIEGKIAGFIFG